MYKKYQDTAEREMGESNILTLANPDFFDGYNPVLELTNHLIEKHGVKDIAFLTGRKKHPHSLERLSAFKTAMQNHKLDVPKERIIEVIHWWI